MTKKTIVLGASDNPARYSYKAIHALLSHGHEVVPVGIKDVEVAGMKIIKGFPTINNLHTITLYVGKSKQEQYYDYLINLKPQRIIFNPGTENPDFKLICEQNGIETVQNCTLIMLANNLF